VLVRKFPVVSLLSLPIGLVSNAVLAGMVITLVADVQDGRGDAGARELVTVVKPVLGRLIVVSFVVGVGEVVRFCY
jgi:hypothetical protein